MIPFRLPPLSRVCEHPLSLHFDGNARLKVEYLSEYMRDFNMTLMQKTEMKRHFNFKLEFNSVSRREVIALYSFSIGKLKFILVR